MIAKASMQITPSKGLLSITLIFGHSINTKNKVGKTVVNECFGQKDRRKREFFAFYTGPGILQIEIKLNYSK